MTVFSSRKSTSRHEQVRLLFRCDGGTEIGLGHVVGSLRLAKLLAKELGIGAVFVVRESPVVQNLIQKAGFSVEPLSVDISPEEDVYRLIKKRRESEWTGIVINFCKDDLERYTPFFRKIKENSIFLIFMDNPLPLSYRMGDLLINALPHPDYDGYEPEKHPACLDGLEYFLPGVEKPSMSREKKIKSNVERVLIAMGGGDQPNLTSMVLHALVEAHFKGDVDVVLGAACPHFGIIQENMQRLGLNGTVSRNVTDLHDRMMTADIGFSSLGLTTYEMAYCGLPVCIISGSRLNAEAAESYVKKYEAAWHLGCYEEIPLKYIHNSFDALCGDRQTRRNMSNNGRVIGRSIDKILDIICLLMVLECKTF